MTINEIFTNLAAVITAQSDAIELTKATLDIEQGTITRLLKRIDDLEMETANLHISVGRIEENENLTEKIEAALADFDFSDALENAIDNYDFSDKVNDAVCDYDFSEVLNDTLGARSTKQMLYEQINDIIGDHDFESAIEEALGNFDFSDAINSALPDFDELVNDAIRGCDFSEDIEKALRDFDFDALIRENLRGNCGVDIVADTVNSILDIPGGGVNDRLAGIAHDIDALEQCINELTAKGIISSDEIRTALKGFTLSVQVV